MPKGITQISWTDATWNPVTGCTRVSPGCANCYIVRTPPFRKVGRKFETVLNQSTTGVILHPERLDIPSRWRAPKRIFVCSIADLFIDDVPDDFLHDVFDVMTDNPQHTFQVLTKRPKRMQRFLTARWESNEPPPNIWLGTSAENQLWADRRIPYLQWTPAALRFVSIEPALGGVDLTAIRVRDTKIVNALTGVTYFRHKSGELEETDRRMEPLRWVITGGESGPRARPVHPEWLRSLRDQCKDADVAFHLKQWGEYIEVPPQPLAMTHVEHKGDVAISLDGMRDVLTRNNLELIRKRVSMRRVGTKKAGATLDGQVYMEFP